MVKPNYLPMKEYKEEVVAIVHQDDSALTNEERSLLTMANEAAAKAYAPYSKFNVGTAVLLQNGEIVLGSNQENVAYPSGMCAERVALFASGANFPDVAVRLMAIVANSEEFEMDDVITPCGGCRQVIMECQIRQNSPIRMLLSSPKGKVVVVENARTLLPFAFDSEGLRK